MGGSCLYCGFDKNYAALDFHHLNPKEKSFNVNTTAACNWDKLVHEANKCVLLCRNCHSALHHPDMERELWSARQASEKLKINPNKPSPEVTERIIGLLKDYHTKRYIADHTGASVSAVYRVAKAIGDHQMTTARGITIPDGYTEVYGRNERVYRSDLAWNPASDQWEHPKAAPYKPLGMVRSWWCVIRKNP